MAATKSLMFFARSPPVFTEISAHAVRAPLLNSESYPKDATGVAAGVYSVLRMATEALRSVEMVPVP